MSIHAILSPEAQARLKAQRRNSTISSALIAVLTVLVAGILLGLALLPPVLSPSSDFKVKYLPPAIDKPDDNPPSTKNTVRRNPTRPAASSPMARALAAHAVSPVSIPVPEVQVTTAGVDFGDGEYFGTGGIGDGDGGKPEFKKVPPEFRKRCSPTERMERLLEKGGTPRCEEAVVRALDWLKATQKPDGSWTNDHPVAMTGFALLVYLGHCETPQSPEYGETVLNAICFVLLSL